MLFLLTLFAIQLIFNTRVSLYRRIISDIQCRVIETSSWWYSSLYSVSYKSQADQAFKEGWSLIVKNFCDMEFKDHIINWK